MAEANRVHAIRSYIVACCADGKINNEEYLYLKKQSQRFKIKEAELRSAIHEMLLSMGKDKCIKRDYKNCVIFTKEALKFQPDDQETIGILSNAIGSLDEKDLLELARTTINGLEVYKNLLFDKIKNKGSDYHSNSKNKEQPDTQSKAKAIEFLSVASEIKPEDTEVKSRLDELLGRSGFVLIDEEESIPDFPDTFRNVELFRKGGMSSIYTASYFDPDSRWHERKVIIKLLNNKSKQATLQKLFFKEYNILRDIDHSNILKIIRRGKTGELEYYICEFIQGKNLHELVEEGRGLSKKDGKRNRIYDILLGVLKGLQGIHEEGIIHRDIKPANIIITNSANKVKIIDFGLAKTDVYNDKLKEAGTRPYNAPELLTRAYSADNRADIYSFGLLMLELISGRNNRDFVQVLPDTLPNLKRIIIKCTEEAVEARYNYISEIVDEFATEAVIDEFNWCSTHFVDEEVAVKRITESKIKPQKPEVVKEKKNWKVPVIVALLILVFGVAGYISYTIFYNPKTTSIELLPDAGDSKTIDLNQTTDYTYTSTADWLKIAEDKVSGNLKLTTISENNSINKREGEITVAYTNGKEQKISVIQLGLLPRIKVEPEEVLFGSTPDDKLLVSVKSNLSWKIAASEPWVKLDMVEGDGNADVLIQAKGPNPSPETRSAKVIFKGAEKDKQATLIVKQMGLFLLEVKPRSVQLIPVPGKEMKVDIQTNFNWLVDGIPDWLEVTPAEGKSGNSSIQIKYLRKDDQSSVAELRILSSDKKEKIGTVTVKTGEQKILWSEEELLKFVKNLRGSDKRLDMSEVYEFIDENCEVVYTKNGKKMPAAESIDAFLSRVKFGAADKVVANTIKYNDQGKIIEFCQED